MGCSFGVLGWLCVVTVRVVLSLPFTPGMSGSLLIFIFFTSEFLILLKLNGFLEQVVVSRGDLGIRKWVNWLREDLSSRPYAWLRPDFVPPSPFLVVKDPQTKSSRILVEPHLIDAEFRKAWMPFFLQVWSSRRHC